MIILSQFNLRLLLCCVLQLFLLFVSTSRSSAEIDYGDLPSEFVPPAGWADDTWTDPGGWTVIDVTQEGILPNLPNVDTAAKLNSLINSSRDYRILFFPEGDYYFTTNVVIARDGVRIAGEGVDKTKFYQDGCEFRFKGSGSSTKILSARPSRGDQIIHTVDSNQFQVGDYVMPLVQFPFGANNNSDSFLQEMSEAGRGQIVRIESITGDFLNVNDPLGLDYAELGADGQPLWPDPRLEKINMTKDVGIENVYIEKDRADNRDTIEFDRVTNGFVRGIRSFFTDNKTVEIRRSYRVFVEGNNISQGFRKQSGGKAYGIHFSAHATRCFAFNNKLERLRHAIVFQQGANHCVAAYNHTLSNILLHGNYANNNLIEGNVADAAINFDAVHGINGPYNFIFRNRVIDPTNGEIDPETGELDPNKGSKGLGVFKGATPKVVVGNVTGRLRLENEEWHGANYGVEGTYYDEDFIEWGQLSDGSELPDSLFRTSSPDFMEGYEWPVAGPGLEDPRWGAGNSIPAADRDISVVPLFGDQITVPPPGNQQPVVTITSPSNNENFPDSPASITVSVSATDSDGSIEKVELRQNGILVDSDISAPYEFNLTGLEEGAYEFEARAFDNENAIKSTSVTISVGEVSNLAPIVSFETPNNGSSIVAGSDLYVKVNASDADGKVSNVWLYIDDGLVRKEGVAPYEWGKEDQSDDALAGMEEGTYIFKAVASDKEGLENFVEITVNVIEDESSPEYTGNHVPGAALGIEMAEDEQTLSVVYAHDLSETSMEPLVEVSFDLSTWDSDPNSVEQTSLGTRDGYEFFKATSLTSTEDEAKQFMRVRLVPVAP